MSSPPPPTQTDADEGVSGSGSECFGAGSGQAFRYTQSAGVRHVFFPSLRKGI